MAAADTIKTGFEYIRDTMGALVITYNGNDYDGIGSVKVVERTYSEEGYGEEIDFPIRILEEDLAENSDNPDSGELVTIGGKDFRIVENRPEPFGVIRRLDVTGRYE